MKKIIFVLFAASLLLSAVPVFAGDSATQDLGFNVLPLTALKLEKDEYSLDLSAQGSDVCAPGAPCWSMVQGAMPIASRYGIFNNGATKKITATMTDGWTKLCRAQGIPISFTLTGQCAERVLVQGTPTGANTFVDIEDGQTKTIIQDIGLMDFNWGLSLTKRITYSVKVGSAKHTGGVLTQIGTLQYSILDQ